MSKTDASYAAGALENLAPLRHHLTLGSLNQQLVLDAVCMRLGAALEEASHIAPEARELVFGDRWSAMWATRNRIAHGYLEIDPKTIASTVEHHLDAFPLSLVRATVVPLPREALHKWLGLFRQCQIDYDGIEARGWFSLALGKRGMRSAACG